MPFCVRVMILCNIFVELEHFNNFDLYHNFIYKLQNKHKIHGSPSQVVLVKM